MRKEHKHPLSAVLVRQKAEEQLIRKNSVKAAPQTEAGILSLLHELEVHRIELEMQNDELRLARDLAETAVEKFTQLYDFAPAGYFTISHKGTMRALNLTGAGMLGMERSALISKSFRQFVTRENRQEFNSFLQQVYETGIKQTCELQLASKGDQSIFIHLEGIISADDQNCHVTAIDITQRWRAEEALKESEFHLRERNATKEKFFAIISHDLRSPISSIIGYSNLLVEQIQNRDYQGIEEYGGIIRDCSLRVMDLLKNLFDWSSVQTGKMDFNPEYVEGIALIKEALALSYGTAQQKSIAISMELPQTVKVFVDKAMISIVLRNLISNAIKFTHPGGKIIVSARQKEHVTEVSVLDNGVGIRNDEIRKLFLNEGLASTAGTQNEMGTGLGLLLCKEFVLKHAGKIWVESELGKGSKFCFTLPKR